MPKKKPPFVLACGGRGCDADEGDCKTQRQAKLLGWQDIAEEDGPSWNYIGLCPQCVTDDTT